ncbi:DNase I-like protein [Fistulina hepatica ATCC 64428]|uniref:DNase I-like protein n=1 Tax=Fistulina hepatica ATCC 64428 TaxID=1128425 RepID=A0A0D7A6N2_9AGAR|nr:DNase I-like protein [Fistulina hepatica ATCC 64428]
MENFAVSLGRFIKPTETVVASLLAVEVLPDNEDEHGVNVLLVVVSHKDPYSGREEGGLLVLRYKRVIEHYDFRVRHTYPIRDEFSITMSQVKLPDTGIHQAVDSSTAFNLIIRADTGKIVSPRFYTTDLDRLKILLSAYKSFLEPSVAFPGDFNPSAYSWLALYLLHQLSASLPTVPLDLRMRHEPLIARLSPACAGLLGNEANDLLIVRDEWILQEAHRLSRIGKCRLKIRVGTFNVNGKNPSQDLSAWLGSQDAVNVPFSPPANQLSTLSVGDADRDPFDDINAVKESPDKPQTKGGALLVEDVYDADAAQDADMLVLGFQELDLSTEALLYSTSTLKEDAWCSSIFASLGEKAVLYTKLASHQLVGMLVVVLVKKSLEACFSNIQTCAVGAGIMGIMGNKGGTAVRLEFTAPQPPSTQVDGQQETPTEKTQAERARESGPIGLTFVNAHLAAYDDMVERRNADFADLSKRMVFDAVFRIEKEGDLNAPNPEPVDVDPPVTSIYNSDALFWMGGECSQSHSPSAHLESVIDLNYRLDLLDGDVREILQASYWSNKIETLLKYDQLKNSMLKNKAFHHFSEPPIYHTPSYRYGSGATDSLGYDLKRRPAWCDRILFMDSPAATVSPTEYWCHREITLSDHRPVSASFSIDIDVYDRRLKHQQFRKLYRQLAIFETPDHMQGYTEISLSSSTIELEQFSATHLEDDYFGMHWQGKHAQPSSCPSGWVEHRLVKICDEVDLVIPSHLSSAPPWLKVQPSSGLLLSGQSEDIEITALVDDELAVSMNFGDRKLYATLVLHAFMGKDKFISVSAEYHRTCFATTMSILGRLPCPVRNVASLGDLLPASQSLPKEFSRLITYLMTYGTETDDLFIAAADEDVLAIIRECIDTGRDFPDPGTLQITHAVAQTLIQLMDSLQEPVFPYALHTRCTQATSREQAFELLDGLTADVVNVS